MDKTKTLTPLEIANTVLAEWAESMRGSWADVDGRWVRSNIYRLIDAQTEESVDIVSLRFDVDVCPYGGGHWTEFCDENCSQL